MKLYHTMVNQNVRLNGHDKTFFKDDVDCNVRLFCISFGFTALLGAPRR